MLRHPEAYKLYREGFFTGIKSFRDFEQRIDLKIPIPDPSDETPEESEAWSKKKGDVFEVFAEAYLKLKRGYLYKEIWPLISSPSQVTKDLNIPVKDKGIDIITQNMTPEVSNIYDVIQVKYRSGRRPLSYSILSTFFGLADSDKIGAKIVFTNSDIVSQDAEDRHKYLKIGPALLDSLTESDFKLIEEYVSSGKIIKLPRKRREYQDQAVKALVDEFGISNRAQLIMACGTGKTMVCMWIAEELSPKSIIIFLPSLALINQTLHQWTQYTSFTNFIPLCVCSDASLESMPDIDDAITDDPRDLDFKVTTDSDEVTRFLNARFSGIKIIFSTYQSAHVVAKGMPVGFSFDIGIFDEAHKTVGLAKKEYAFALSDSNLQIAKRLFTTATPKRRKLSKDINGNIDEIYSMNDETIYGRRAYNLSFNNAAKQGIICKYKVIVTVVTSAEMYEKINSNNLNIINEDVTISDSQILERLAVESAIKKCEAKKIITFHQLKSHAKSFSTFDESKYGSFFPGYHIAHIFGEMRANQRKRIFDEFSESKKAILANARCLTEGVDLPAVDMVAFLSRKRSKVDIIQAIGRTLRIPDPNVQKKDTGYVLIPLFINISPGMSLMDAIESADYDEIWDVINALSDHDDGLSAVIKNFTVERARYRKLNFSALRDYIDVVTTLGEIRESVTSKCIEGLLLSWDEYYGRLLAYHDLNGHINVPNDTEENQELVQWMYNQRSRYSDGLMPKEDIEKLNKINFVWDKFDVQWNSMYLKAKKFKELNGHFNVPKVDEESKTLSTWITRQRSKLKTGNLFESQKILLDSIDFDWDVLKDLWDESFDALKAFFLEFGHCELPEDKRYEKLNIWVKNQRQKFKVGKLSEDRVKKLNSVNFIWNARDFAWMDFYNRLLVFKKQHNHCNVPEGYINDPELSIWVSNNRFNPPKDPKRISLLNEIGFTFKFRDEIWSQMVDSLSAYRQKFGNCAVPVNYEGDKKLGKWVSNLRVLKRKGLLQADREAELNKLDFIWAIKPSLPNRRDWDESYDSLCIFYTKYGHTDVPKKHLEDKSLPKWVQRQRESMKKGDLSEGQIKKLNLINFNWDPLEDQWMENYKLLIDFKNLHGHCMVPRGYSLNPSLALWVGRQRKAYAKGDIIVERLKLLERLNFEWESTRGKK
jgi:superfamily II DNA or RNA helicase